MNGKKLKGEFALVRMKNSDKNWLLLKKHDQYAEHTEANAKNTNEHTAHDDSADTATHHNPHEHVEASRTCRHTAGSDHTMETFDPEVFDQPIKPMLATLVNDIIDRPEWIYELKWDGYRAIAKIHNGEVELISRNQQPFNGDFAPIVKSLQEVKDTMILDGEVVVIDEKGKAEFQLLQNYKSTGKGNLIYYVFDILYLNGKDLRDLPLLERKEILQQNLPPLPHIAVSDHVVEKGKELFALARAQGLEGIMAKKATSIYREGIRSKDWLKIKTHHQQEAIICGITEPRGSRHAFGALILGVYDNNKLTYVGHAGTGFSDKELNYLKKKFEKYFVSRCPFEKAPKVNAPVTWMKPHLVCEVSFAEWTEDTMMRQPSFLGLREDKKPQEVKREIPQKASQVINHNSANHNSVSHNNHNNEPKKSLTATRSHTQKQELTLTHQEKMYWPKEKYTKGDLLEYYNKIWPYIQPYLKDRPQTLHRFPHGIEGESFYQKDIKDETPPWLTTVEIYSETEDKYIRYAVANNKESLLYLVNLGCIEINIWNARMQKTDYPDYAVIDLDPLEISFDKVVETALMVKKILDKAKVQSFCKTSGATGLHIYIPLGAKYTTDQVLTFSEIIALLVHAQLPTITSIERSPQERRRKVYIDYMQNRKHQTMVAPYSVRCSGIHTLGLERGKKGIRSKRFYL